MDSDPFSADLYIFCNRARTLLKMVAWEGNGFVLWMKRLEKSRFKWPLSRSGSVMQLTVQEINWLLAPLGSARRAAGAPDPALRLRSVAITTRTDPLVGRLFRLSADRRL